PKSLALIATAADVMSPQVKTRLGRYIFQTTACSHARRSSRLSLTRKTTTKHRLRHTQRPRSPSRPTKSLRAIPRQTQQRQRLHRHHLREKT
ncbi:hypothetical protein IWW38_004409, partial [Coemansia aciculifera]